MTIEIKELNVVDKNKALEELVDRELTRLFPRRLIKKILLIAPPDMDISLFDYATAKRGRYWNFPPYGLGLIATHLRNNGLNVEIINLNHEVLKACRLSYSKDDFDFDYTWQTVLFREITNFKPDIVGLTCMFTQTHNSAVRVCNEIKRIDSILPIIIGGVHITNCFLEDKASVQLLRDFNNADVFFLFEAELAFIEFIKVVNQKAPISKLHQVYFNSAQEKLYFSKKEIPYGSQLNVIPAHDLMNSAELINYGVVGSFCCFKEKGTRITTVLANRGCRGQCAYCSVRNFNGPGVRQRSVESIIDELFLLKEKYNITHIMWLDDDLLYGHQHALRLFNEMAQKKIGITWDCTNGVLALSCTDEIIAAAVESGCIGLTIGVESGNPEVLKKIKKPGNINTFLKAAGVLKKYEQITTRIFLMIGFPRETYREILDTFDLALKIDLDWYNITIFQPLPNTPLFKSLRKDSFTKQFEFEDIRYNSGPYGKIRGKINKDIALSDLGNPFENVDLDTIPNRTQLDDIWFYMNYHLNFARLYKEDRSLKLKQHLKYLQHVVNLVAPEDPFPMYFCAYLQKKIHDKIDDQLIKRIEDRLRSSEYWRNKFVKFNLSLDAIKVGNFSFLHL